MYFYPTKHVWHHGADVGFDVDLFDTGTVSIVRVAKNSPNIGRHSIIKIESLFRMTNAPTHTKPHPTIRTPVIHPFIAKFQANDGAATLTGSSPIRRVRRWTTRFIIVSIMVLAVESGLL